MPIYEFKCRDCGKVSEVFVHPTNVVPSNCPSCGSEYLEKLFSPSHVIRSGTRTSSTTCCGKTERCDKPPCSPHDSCQRNRKHG